MELTFGAVQEIFTGVNASAAHMSDNSIWGFQVLDGQLQGSKVENAGDVDWEAVIMSDFAVVTADAGVSLVKLKNIPRTGIYGVWLQAANEALNTPERHRLAIWTGEIDVSDHLKSCSITFEDETPVASANMSFENPDQALSGEIDSYIKPGMKLELKLQMGDDEPYPISVQYVDRVDMGVTDSEITVESRNISGKLLSDQTLDEMTDYPFQYYHLNVVDLLQKAGILDYEVQDTGVWNFGLRLDPATTFLKALNEFVAHALNWKVVEDQDGTIIVGSTVTYLPIQRTSTYEFDRGTNIWSRKIIRDDDELYSRVCGRYELTLDEGLDTERVETQYIYTPVTNLSDWSVAPQKTLYIDFPKESESADVTSVIEEVAALIGMAGTQETFAGPIRPNLITGDEAKINSDDGSKTLGLVTTIKHTFGKKGFYTEFTVDSAGRKGKPKLSTYIDTMTRTKIGSGERLF